MTTAGHRKKSDFTQRPLPPVHKTSGVDHVIRGEKVILDRDLAELYGVETKQLNRAVKRNKSRFPQDLMFQLTLKEAVSLRCQNGTSKTARGGRRYSPYVFTEHGVVMLSVCSQQRASGPNEPLDH